MLLLKLEQENDNKVIFDYFPENKNEYGVLELDKATGEISVVKVADSDKYNTYLHHAVSQVLKFFEDNSYQRETEVTWY